MRSGEKQIFILDIMIFNIIYIYLSIHMKSVILYCLDKENVTSLHVLKFL